MRTNPHSLQNNAFFPLGQKGQVTVELMVILSVLLIILVFSIRIFGDQSVQVIQTQGLYELQRNTQLISNSIYLLQISPVGTTTELLIRPSLEDENFTFRGRNLYGTSASFTVIESLPNTPITSPSLTAGERIRMQRTVGGIIISLNGGS